MIDNLNPPPIVQDQHQQAKYWHKKAVEAHQARSSSSLDHAEALYHISECNGHVDLGHKTFGEYVFNSFGKSKQWGNKLVSIHKKFVVELKQTKTTLKEITFGKVSKLVSVVDKDNVSDLLEFAKTATQQQVDHKVKELQGLDPNETKVDDEFTSLRFKMPAEVVDVVKDSLDMAREEYKQSRGVEKVQDFQALEIMAATYATTRDISGDLEETLNNLFFRLSQAYNIDISWEIKNE